MIPMSGAGVVRVLAPRDLDQIGPGRHRRARIIGAVPSRGKYPWRHDRPVHQRLDGGRGRRRDFIVLNDRQPDIRGGLSLRNLDRDTGDLML